MSDHDNSEEARRVYIDSQRTKVYAGMSTDEFLDYFEKAGDEYRFWQEEYAATLRYMRANKLQTQFLERIRNG